MSSARSPRSGPGRLRRFWRTSGRPAFIALALAAGLGGTAALATIFLGLYNVSATEQHTAPVYWALEAGMLNAVKRRASGIAVPDLSDDGLVRRGLVLHRDACVQCHGAPGVSPGDAGKALLPAPNSLVQTAREWSAAQIYWVTKNGLKMTGMPAWGMRYPEADLWAIVAFVKHLPRLTAADYEQMSARAGAGEARAAAWPALVPGNAGRGLYALQQYACTTCHLIPGMVGANAHVGPSLAGLAERKYLGGRLPNTPDNLVRWIRYPREVSSQSLMPDLGVTEQHARDMAAYLLTLKGGVK